MKQTVHGIPPTHPPLKKRPPPKKKKTPSPPTTWNSQNVCEHVILTSIFLQHLPVQTHTLLYIRLFNYKNSQTDRQTDRQTDTHTHTCMYAHTHTHSHIHACTQTSMHMHTHTMTHTHTRMHTNKHAHAHTDTHTHTHTKQRWVDTQFTHIQDKKTQLNCCCLFLSLSCNGENGLTS